MKVFKIFVLLSLFFVSFSSLAMFRGHSGQMLVASGGGFPPPGDGGGGHQPIGFYVVDPEYMNQLHERLALLSSEMELLQAQLNETRRQAGASAHAHQNLQAQHESVLADLRNSLAELDQVRQGNRFLMEENAQLRMRLAQQQGDSPQTLLLRGEVMRLSRQIQALQAEILQLQKELRKSKRLNRSHMIGDQVRSQQQREDASHN